MNIRRLLALTERYLELSFKSKWRTIELLYYSVMSLLMWGFFTLASKGNVLEFAYFFLSVQIFWAFAFQAQNNFSISFMEDVWGRSFKEMMAAPITKTEYITARAVVALVRSAITFAVLCLIAYFGFGLTILSTNLNFFLALAGITLTSSVAIGVIIDGAILLLGLEYSFFVWSSIQLFMLFSCPFYPIDIFPTQMHFFVKSMPYYWVFVGLKEFFANKITLEPFINGLFVSVAYLVISIPIYVICLKKSKIKGTISKL